MGPEQLTVLIAASSILNKLGTWPFGSILLIVILGPWILLFFISRGQEKRFEAVRDMYEENVKLVKDFNHLAGDQQDLIIANTEAMTALKTVAENNLFCPLVRKSSQQKEISG